ncbi:carboxypeptidase-like regulatory domain-containing protein [Parabacteroides goldsteinii]|jgi:hypothetical protein|uniref:carboxypeptidase-like regulatory domain-containing protein n=1 Tax=Parabacteroides goldsteinii TaxID=328812 RepID=UPI0022E76403|nr:carboxypeptidase-like regulatory domain-containing protein [Parabacteroides goldsteinii]
MGMWLLKLVVLTIALYALYHWALRGSTFFHFNRRFLLLGILLAMVFPFVPLVYEPAVTEATQKVSENLFRIGNAVTIQVDTGLIGGAGKIFEYIYWTGVIVLLLTRYRSVRLIMHCIKEGKKTVFPQFTLIENSSISSSFSFLRYIILPAKINETDKDIIMVHEQTHVMQRHYIDLFLSELFCISQWFNPFVWLYKRDVVENHEFLADRSASRTWGIEIYKETLTGFWLYGTLKNLVNPFAYSTRLMRLSMLKKPASPAIRKCWTIGLVPILFLYIYLFAVPTSQAVTVSNVEQVGITGNITDKANNKIVGASIVIPSKATGTISDVDGSFRLSASHMDTLHIYMKGYEKQQFCLADYATNGSEIQIEIKLQPLNK